MDLGTKKYSNFTAVESPKTILIPVAAICEIEQHFDSCEHMLLVETNSVDAGM